jgi:Zn-dependent M32 family carboxypeptidase
MNYEKIGAGAGCDEILDELPITFWNFIQELEEENKSQQEKLGIEVRELQRSLEKFREMKQKSDAEKQRLKGKAMEIEKNNEMDTSYFLYSQKELQDEMEYCRSVISYAKSKLCLYEILGKISFSSGGAAGQIDKTGQIFNFDDLSTYEQVNSLWELL